MSSHARVNASDAHRRDSTLPLRPFSLGRFIRDAAEIRKNRLTSEDSGIEAVERWTEFGVAGINSYRKYRAQIDLSANYIDETWLENHEPNIVYDYDSVMGRSKNLPYSCAIEVYPTFGFGFKLMKSLHIGPVPLNNTHGRQIEDFHVPHVCFGTVQTRHTIRLMLPGAINYNNLQDRALSPKLLADLYDHCIYPACLETVGQGEAGHWLPTYRTELERQQRGNSGHLGKSGRLIPARKVGAFGRAILEKISTMPWGKEAYFFHELRGKRGATQHGWDEREGALEDMLEIIRTDRIDKREWWIDIGVEIQCPGYVNWWRTDAHEWIVSEVLNINAASTQSLLRQQHSYQIDHPCHLEDISGFRLKVPRLLRDRTGVCYMQAYNTEKEAIYKLSGNKNTEILEFKHVIMNPRYKIASYSDSLTSIWHKMRRKSDGHARFEIRINMAKLDLDESSFLDISDDFLMSALCSIPRHVWWDFKLLRLTTMTQAIRWWQEAEDGRNHTRALALVLCLVYLINGLSSRSVTLPAENAIHHLMIRDMLNIEEEDRGPVNPLGILFPSSIIICGPINFAPRLGLGMEFEDSIYYRLLDGRSRMSVQMALSGQTVHVGVQPTADIQRVMHQNRRLLMRHRGAATEDEQVEISEMVKLTIDGANDPAPRAQGMQTELEKMVSNLYARAFMDIITCSPNRKGVENPPYCKMSIQERGRASFYTFQQSNLATVWTQCIVMSGTSDEWDSAFNYLFPDRVVVSANRLQNYDNCRFWVEWRDLMKTTLQDSRHELQSSVRSNWNQLAWMPWTRSDRIWTTLRPDNNKLNNRNCTVYPEGYTGPAPVLITNPAWTGEPICFQPQEN